MYFLEFFGKSINFVLETSIIQYPNLGKTTKLITKNFIMAYFFFQTKFWQGHLIFNLLFYKFVNMNFEGMRKTYVIS